MSKLFYKEKKTLMKLCKAEGCKAWYRPEYRSWNARLGFCYDHRKMYYKEWNRKVFLPWLKKQTPEKRALVKKLRRQAWDKWVANNIDKRREQALRSYHANKAKHQAHRNKLRRARYAAKMKH